VPKPFDQGVSVVAFVADQRAETLVCTRGPNFPLSQLKSRGLWISARTNAMIFARRMLPMMSFSIFKARL
jgi:hypothetical protein